MKIRVFNYSRAYRAKRAVHYIAGYMSVCGLGFLFACLLLGATEYLFPLAVLMTFWAVVSVASNPNKSGGYDE